MTRFHEPLTELELRFHSGLAMALRLAKGDRCEFTFSSWRRGMEKVFGYEHDFRRWPHDFDPKESTFFSVNASLRNLQWDFDGCGEIPMSKARAQRQLDEVCAGPPAWTAGGVWSPDSFHQLVREILAASQREPS